MDDDEMEEILYRLDERTEMIDKKIEIQNEKIVAQRERLNKVENMSQDNRMIISGVTFGVGTFLTIVMGKLAGLVTF